jgi:hypothetical protein
MIAATLAVMASLLVAHGVAAAPEEDGVREKRLQAPVALECPLTHPVYCFSPSPGNEAVVPIKFAKTALPIERICFTVRLEGDLLDIGETIFITFSPDPFAQAFGQTNIDSPTPITEFTTCLAAGLHDDLLALLAVKKPTVFVYMHQGSATLADVEVFLLPG